MKRLISAVALCAALIAAPASADPILFGYAAVSCGLDDPHDTTDRVDYADEVADFTTANQVCITADADETAARLARTAALFTPVFYIEPVFFSQSPRRLRPNPDADALWEYTVATIAASDVPADDLIFYLVDEPTLRRLPLSAVSAAARVIKGTFPNARILMIEAFAPDDPVAIPAGVDIWGFNTYALRDPAADPAFIRQLTSARAALGPRQSLALIMDAQYTPVHAAAGLTEADMADVARAYARLARSTPEVSIMLGYTWAGGIDGPWEKGLRDLPQPVIAAHRQIGRALRN